MKLIDTNVLLRLLLGDDNILSVKAEKLVSKAKPGSLLITDVIVAEIVYVLRSTGRDRKQTSEALLLLDRTLPFKYENEELIKRVINLITNTKLDFADCYLLARAQREKIGLETFDVALAKLHSS